MTDAALDRPDVAVFPPVIPLATLLLACVLQWLVPLDRSPISIRRCGSDRACHCPRGAGHDVSWKTRAGQKGPTSIRRSRPHRSVTDGVFGHTRNPLYVGVSIALCGCADFHLDWMLLLIIPSCIFLHFAVVKRESVYLSRNSATPIVATRRAYPAISRQLKPFPSGNGFQRKRSWSNHFFALAFPSRLQGMAFGIFMGIKQDFMLAPAHAHLNLLGFVTMSFPRCIIALSAGGGEQLAVIRRSSA